MAVVEAVLEQAMLVGGVLDSPPLAVLVELMGAVCCSPGLAAQEQA